VAEAVISRGGDYLVVIKAINPSVAGVCCTR
jgi:hypothetical protein